MIGYGNAADLRSVLLICTTLMTFLTFPRIFFSFWETLNGMWTMYKSRRICKRKKETEEKLKKYCEIDMRKFR